MSLFDHLRVPGPGRIRQLARTPLGWSPERPGPGLRLLPPICIGLTYIVWLAQAVGLPDQDGGLWTWHYAPGNAHLFMRLMLLVLVPVSGALSFRREADRGTLEALLLTPAPRGPIVWGRCLWVIRFWLPCLAALLPIYVLMCSHPTEVFRSDYLFDLLRGRPDDWPKALRTLLLPRPVFALPWSMWNLCQGAAGGPLSLGTAGSVCLWLALPPTTINVTGDPWLLPDPQLLVVNPLRLAGDLLLLWYLAGTGVYASVRCRTLPRALAAAFLLGPFMLVTVLSLDIWASPLCRLLGHAYVVVPIGCLLATVQLPVALLRRATRDFDRHFLAGR